MKKFLQQLSRVIFVLAITPFILVGFAFHLAAGGFRLAEDLLFYWVDSL